VYLTVRNPVAFGAGTKQRAVSLVQGDSTTLSVKRHGAGPLHYLWYKDNVLLETEDSPEYKISGATNADNGVYAVLAYNEFSAVGVTSATIAQDSPQMFDLDPLPIAQVNVQATATLSAVLVNGGSVASEVATVKDASTVTLRASVWPESVR